MMIKITEHCSMGCTHCMNNATPNNKHMDFDTFKQVINFQKQYGGQFCIITGGEPTEHPNFMSFISYACNFMIGYYITVTTNGLWMQNNPDKVKYLYDTYGKQLMFQVTNDTRYYPVCIDKNHSIFTLDNVVMCDKVKHIYPQGRAVDNNIEWNSKASKCFNIRAITNQVSIKNLGIIIGMLAVKGKFCTPHIDIHGNIKLGESDLCPVCSHINKTHDDIIKDILDFRCKQCDNINGQLSQEYRSIIGES